VRHVFSSVFSSPSEIELYDRTGEPFLIFEGFLHTCHHAESDSPNTLNYLGSRYELKPAEKVSLLEKQFLASNAEDIGKFATALIQKEYIDTIQNLKDKEAGLHDVFQASKSFSIERFLIEQVFPIYDAIYDKNFDPEMNDQPALKKTKVVIPEIEQLEVRELAGDSSILERILEKRQVLKFGNDVFACVEGTTSDETYCEIKGKRYGLQLISTSKELADKYRGALEQELEKRIRRNAGKYKEVMLALQENIEKLKDTTDGEPVGNSYEMRARDSTIGFKKEGKKKYMIFVDIDPYVVEKGGRFYAFEEKIRIGTYMSINKNEVKITGKPVVLHNEKPIPFVGGGGNVCYDHGGRFEYIDADFAWRKIEQLDDIDYARNIAAIMHTARYFFEHCTHYLLNAGHTREVQRAPDGVRVIKIG